MARTPPAKDATDVHYSHRDNAKADFKTAGIDVIAARANKAIIINLFEEVILSLKMVTKVGMAL